MNDFNYINGKLYCEKVSVQDIAKCIKTPFYLYSKATLINHYKVFEKAFSQIDHLICFSAKSNTSLSVLKTFQSLGSGLDIVSGGELYKGLAAGFNPDKIVYSGVGKRKDEIDDALQSNIFMFNVESLEELEILDQRAALTGKKAKISIRVNPDVNPLTHPYISTGLKENKFGVDIKTAIKGYKAAKSKKNLEPIGIDCHIGSQITEIKPFKDALENLKKLMQDLRDDGISIKYIDIGGGLGITYQDESPPCPDEYAKAITWSLKDSGITLILEPGRVLAGNAGILVTKVIYKKKTPDKIFIIADAAMNDLIRPALYGAFHEIIPADKTQKRPLIKADIVGPICETGDFLAKDREIRDLKSGDIIAVMSAGAYGYTMASNYCSRLRPSEVMVYRDKFTEIRKAQEYKDLIVGEITD